LGNPVPQYDGELVRDIKPDLTLPADVYTALSMHKLTPHTEWYEFPGIPPRYVALWCVRSAGSGGETTLADGYRFLREFSATEIVLLHRRVYEWYGLPGTSDGPSSVVSRPVLEDHPDGLIMRYSYQFLQRVEDGLVPRYIDSGGRFFADEHLDIAIERNSMLLWDNWRMIHARNAFSDPYRHLCRVLLAVKSA
jgi:alpha-ketoglutarate-dependent taurine dioxygenase